MACSINTPSIKFKMNKRARLLRVTRMTGSEIERLGKRTTM